MDWGSNQADVIDRLYLAFINGTGGRGELFNVFASVVLVALVTLRYFSI